MKPQNTWTRRRHRVARNVLCAILGPYARMRYHISVEPFAAQGTRPYVILFNHQTAFDQFFVGMAFQGPVYYVASEDLFSNGLTSSLIRCLVAPIPIKKQTTDITAVKNCLKVAKEGGTIAIAPEGNRTFDGKLAYIKPTIAKLVRALRMPVAIFRIEDGYGVQPRWSNVVRKGSMRAYVSRVIEPEEARAMTDDELLHVLTEALNVDEARVTGKFTHKRLAEYLERVLYVCPQCGLTEFESRNDRIRCKTCGLTARYLPTKELEGVPYRFVADWYAAQEQFVRNLDLTPYYDNPMYRESARVSEVIPCKRKDTLFRRAALSLYADRLEIRGREGKLTLHFDETSVCTVLGKNKLNIYHRDRIYQLKGDVRFNALKYMNLFYHYKNTKEGVEDEQFLGL